MLTNQGSSDYRVHLTDEDRNSGLLSNKDEDANIHPNELSGDQNGEQSIFASSLEATKANFFLTVTTIIKTVIGSGILAIPYSMSKMGYVFGSVVFVLAAMVIQYGSVLLLKAKNMARHSNYSTILYAIWKSKISKGMGSLFIFLNNIGVCIAELIIFKSSIRKIFKDVIGDQDILDSFYTQEIFLVLFMALLESPLTLVSKMQKLKFMAMIGVIGIVVFMATFCIFFIFAVADENPANNPVGNMEMFPTRWFSAAAAVPNLMLALSYQVNFFPIYKGMKNVTDSKIAKASLVGVLFCTFAYLLVGILGYDYVGPNVQPSFLESLEYHRIAKPFFFIINFSFLLSIFFAFPIMFFGCRNNFIGLAKLAVTPQTQRPNQWRAGDEVEEISSYIRDQQHTQRKRKAKLHFIIYTLALYVVIVGVAMSVQDIEAVFNVIGAVCSTSVGVLLPCFFYFKLILKKKQKRTYNFYLSIIIFSTIAPYALFSIIALYVGPE